LLYSKRQCQQQQQSYNSCSGIAAALAAPLAKNYECGRKQSTSGNSANKPALAKQFNSVKA